MTDFAFYNAGDDGPVGARRVILPLRRLLRRVLRPIFQTLSEWMRQTSGRIDEHDAAVAGLIARQDARSDEMQAALAFGWDYVAMARRLAALEDRVEALTALAEGRASLPFPETDTMPRAEAG